MKIKEDLDISTSDFWYDLTQGGYIHPEKILEDSKDIERVMNAISILEEFEESCIEQIEDFLQ